MRKIIASTFATLDGVMQAPGGPEEDPTGGFTEGGWSFSYWDETMDKAMGETMSVPFDLLLGRKTYEIFAAHWPYAGDNPITAIFNKAIKHVASRTLSRLDWVNSKLIQGDVAGEVARLKAGDGPELQVHGSSGLLQTLTGAGLVDEYRVWIFPLVLGHGKRLFEKGAPPRAACPDRQQIVVHRRLDQHLPARRGGQAGILRPSDAVGGRTGAACEDGARGLGSAVEEKRREQ
jgi:dihydrofolate reductase